MAVEQKIYVVKITVVDSLIITKVKFKILGKLLVPFIMSKVHTNVTFQISSKLFWFQ